MSFDSIATTMILDRSAARAAPPPSFDLQDSRHGDAIAQASLVARLSASIGAQGGGAPGLGAVMILQGLGRFEVQIRLGGTAVCIRIRCDSERGRAWLCQRRSSLEARLAQRMGRAVEISPAGP